MHFSFFIGCLTTHGILTLNEDNPDFRPFSPSLTSPNANSYGLVINQNDDFIDMEVEENVIGAVIGPAGRSIIELQQLSGAKIQISKKGSFSPGTRNRVVTVSGPTQAVAAAKYLIEKKIHEEDGKRLN